MATVASAAAATAAAGMSDGDKVLLPRGSSTLSLTLSQTVASLPPLALAGQPGAPATEGPGRPRLGLGTYPSGSRPSPVEGATGDRRTRRLP